MESIAEIKSGLHHYIAKTNNVEALAKLQKYISKLLAKKGGIIAYTTKGLH